MSCEDIPSLLDLQNTKRNIDDFARLMGTGTGTSTNGVTGQVRPTYNKVIEDIGFKPGSGDFTTGFTVMPGERDVAWYDPVSHNWYSYLGTIPSTGYVVPPGTNPVGDSNWKPITDKIMWNKLRSPDGSSTVGFQQVGAGSVPRTVQDKLRDIVSVTDKGALGGTNDDTVAFQKAVAEGGGYAFVPYNPLGYTVNAHIDGAVGFGDITFKGTGLVNYTNLSKQDGEYLTCANIKKRISAGESITLACFGDSTMYGYEVGGATAQVQDPNNPPYLLGNTLTALYGRPFTVINAGISSSSMRKMMGGTDMVPTTPYEKRIAPGGIASDASVVYCNHAINDCQSDLSIDKFRHDYFEFVRITRKYGKVPVLVTPNPLLPFGADGARKTRQIDIYAQVIRDVAKATGCDLVDQYYYVKQTAKRYPETVLIPDYVHPSSAMYKQCGRNLAIPLVNATVLSKPGDFASLSGSTYRDSQNSQMVLRTETKVGFCAYGTRAASMKGITMAAIFDEPFEMVSFMGLKWVNGAKVLTGILDNAQQWGIFSCGSKYGTLNLEDWDTDFPVRASCMAGLQPLYWLFDMSDTRPANNNLVFSGVAIPNQFPISAHGVRKLSAQDRKNNVLNVNYNIAFSINIDPGLGNVPTLSDAAGFVVLKVLWSGADMIVELRSDGGLVETATLSTSEPAGEKYFRIFNMGDKVRIEMTRHKSGIFATVDMPTTESLPPLWLTYPPVPFTIAPNI